MIIWVGSICWWVWYKNRDFMYCIFWGGWGSFNGPGLWCCCIKHKTVTGPVTDIPSRFLPLRFIWYRWRLPTLPPKDFYGSGSLLYRSWLLLFSFWLSFYLFIIITVKLLWIQNYELNNLSDKYVELCIQSIAYEFRQK